MIPPEIDIDQWFFQLFWVTDSFEKLMNTVEPSGLIVSVHTVLLCQEGHRFPELL